MKVLKCNQPVYVDVDGTLLIHDVAGTSPDAIDINGVKFIPHKRHIEQIKAHKARGHTVVIWSQGGYEWCETAVQVLGIEEFVDYVMEKPMWIIDDLPPEAWMERYFYDMDGKVEIGQEAFTKEEIEEKV